MPAAASEGAGPVERGITYAAAGGLAGGLFGMAQAAWNVSHVAESEAMTFVARRSAVHGGNLAAIAGVFALTDTLLTESRGHSFAHPMAAGCLAGSLLGAQQGSVSKAGIGCIVFGAIQGIGQLCPSRSYRCSCLHVSLEHLRR